MSLIWRFPYKPIFFNSLRSFTSLGSHFDADELSQLPSPQIFCNSLKHKQIIDFNNSGCWLALTAGEVFVTAMSKSSKTVAIVLSLTLAIVAGFNLSSPQVKHALSAVASAVWGS